MSNHRRAAELVAAVRRATRWIRENMDLDAPSGRWGDSFGFSCPTEALNGGIQTVNFGRLLDRGPLAPGQEVFLRQFRLEFRRLQQVVGLLRTVDAILADRVPETELVSKFFAELCGFDLYRFEIRVRPTRYLDPDVFIRVAPTYEVVGTPFRISSRLIDDLDSAADSAAGMIIARQPSVTKPELLSDPRNYFRRTDRDWTVCYLGHEPFSIRRRTAGAAHLHYLLQRPREAVSAATLKASWDAFNTDRKRGQADSRAESISAMNDGEVMDDIGLEKAQEEYDLTASDLVQAETNEDIGTVERLQQELNAIQNAILEAKGHNGEPGLLGCQQKKTRDAVTKAISRVITSIGESDRDLGLHLEDCVKTGPTCLYSPVPPVTWET